MKKLLLVFMVVAFLLPATLAGAQTTVTVWFGRQEFIPADAFETFHAENPDIRVEFDVIPLEESHVDFMRNHAVGVAPDVVQIFGEFLATMVVRGTLLDITEYIEAWAEEDPEDFADIYDIAFDMTTYEDRIYGINVHSGPFFMGYRKDWLAEAGLEEPQTWEELLDACRILQEEVLTGDEYAYAQPGGAHHPPFWMMATFMSMGGQFRDTGTPIVDSEAGIFLIDFYQTLANEGLQDPEAHAWASGDFRGAFMGERAAFYPEAINIYAYTQEVLEYATEWEVMVQPPREGAEDDFRVNSFGWPYMVNSDTEDPEAVMKVLRYLFDPEICVSVALAYQPANRASVMTSDAYYEAHPYFPILEASFAEQVTYPTHLRSVERADILNEMKFVAQQVPAQYTPEEIAARYQELLDALD